MSGAERKKARAGRHPFADFPQQPRTARQFVQSDRLVHPMRHSDREMILEPLPDTWKFMLGCNADRPQVLRRTNPRDLQKLRRADCPGRHQHLTPNPDEAQLSMAAVAQPDHATAVQIKSLDMGVGLDA